MFSAASSTSTVAQPEDGTDSLRLCVTRTDRLPNHSAWVRPTRLTVRRPAQPVSVPGPRVRSRDGTLHPNVIPARSHTRPVSRPGHARPASRGDGVLQSQDGDVRTTMMLVGMMLVAMMLVVTPLAGSDLSSHRLGALNCICSPTASGSGPSRPGLPSRSCARSASTTADRVVVEVARTIIKNVAMFRCASPNPATDRLARSARSAA
jgi:hypothetical protein